MYSNLQRDTTIILISMIFELQYNVTWYAWIRLTPGRGTRGLLYESDAFVAVLWLWPLCTLNSNEMQCLHRDQIDARTSIFFSISPPNAFYISDASCLCGARENWRIKLALQIHNTPPFPNNNNIVVISIGEQTPHKSTTAIQNWVYIILRSRARYNIIGIGISLLLL